jgi:predicted ATPase
MASDAFHSITIKGFKSIRSIEDLPLRPINLLIGANGSGKSSFLDAFVFLKEIMEGRKNKYVAQNGGANKLLFFGSKTTSEIVVSVESSQVPENSPFEHAFTARFLFADGDELVGGITSGIPENDRPSWRCYRFQDTTRESPFKMTNQLHDNRFLRENGSNLAAFLYLLQRRYSDSYTLIRKTVQQVAPFLDGFELAPLVENPETIKLEWRHKNSDQYFGASSFSDGTLRFIALATLFLQPLELRPSLILVDEPELGLHPYAIGLLAALIRQASVETQVIAATQSTTLLDHFDPEDVLVANRVDGATTIERLQPEPLTEWLEDYSLGQLWEKGELSGRPGNEYR